MSDGEVEVEAVQGVQVLPKDVVTEIGSTKLFNKWSYEDVEIRDISLTYVEDLACDDSSGRGDNGIGKTRLTRCCNRDYIQIRQPVYLPHSSGRYAVKRFRKAQCPIIERLTNSLMMNGRNNGKKLMAVRIVAHCFEIVSSNTYHTDPSSGC